MASWWVPMLDAGRGRQPFTTLHKAALGGEIVRMEIAVTALPMRLRHQVLVARAYTSSADVTLALEDSDDGA
jgi:hypothetical protein